MSLFSIRVKDALAQVRSNRMKQIDLEIAKAWSYVQIDINRMSRQNFVDPSVWKNEELVEMIEERMEAIE